MKGKLLIVGLVLIYFLVKLIRGWLQRRSERKKDIEIYGEPLDDGPVESVFCEVCGRQMPEKLYGFIGEFCLEEGHNNCYEPHHRQFPSARYGVARWSLARQP